MFNQKGQAFDVFKLLIAAVVAGVILLLLLSIIGGIPGFGQSDPASKAGTLIRDLATKKGTYDTTDAVNFSAGKTISNISLAEATKGNLQPEDICVLAGDFQDKAGWTELGGGGKSLQYKGSTQQKAVVVGICDTGSRMAEDNYFENYTGGEIDNASWDVSGKCGCVNASIDTTCCVVAVKKSRA